MLVFLKGFLLGIYYHFPASMRFVGGVGTALLRGGWFADADELDLQE